VRKALTGKRPSYIRLSAYFNAMIYGEAMTPTDAQLAHLEKAADVLRVVAHPARLRILQLLEGGEKTVTEIYTALDLPQAYTSQQLSLMKSKDVLASRREGPQVFYRIANRNVLKIIHCVCAESAVETDLA